MDALLGSRIATLFGWCSRRPSGSCVGCCPVAGLGGALVA